MAYATVEDLAARWRPLTQAEQDRAQILLDDAAVRLDTVAPPPDTPTDHDEAVRLIVSCEMVKRAMAVPGGFGVTRTSEAIGPFQQSADFANPTGDLYLTKADRRLLGVGAQSAASINMAPDAGLDYFPGYEDCL